MGFSRYKLIGVIATNMNTNIVNVRSIPPYPSLVFTMLQNIERGGKKFIKEKSLQKISFSLIGNTVIPYKIYMVIYRFLF